MRKQRLFSPIPLFQVLIELTCTEVVNMETEVKTWIRICICKSGESNFMCKTRTLVLLWGCKVFLAFRSDLLKIKTTVNL